MFKKELPNFLRRASIRKSRKYPILRDEFGNSLRKQAFTAFERGERPMGVSRELNANPKTILRYYADWKKLPRNFSVRYQLFMYVRKNTTGLSDELIDLLSKHLGMSPSEIIGRLQKPHGLKQLLFNKWPNYRIQSELSKTERRFRAALNLIDMADLWGISPEVFKDSVMTVLLTRHEFNKNKLK